MKTLSVLMASLGLVSVAACSASGTTGQSPDPEETTNSDAGGAPSKGDAARAITDDAGGAVDAEPELKLGTPETVAPECKVSQRYNEYAKDGYDGGFYAVRVTPKTYPFRVESLSYSLKDGTVISNAGTTYCDQNVPHKLGFFKSAAGQPASAPPDLQIWSAAGTGAERTEALPKPVVLDKGEVGYVLVQFVQGNSATCVRACSTGATPGIHFRTQKSQSPFTWSAYSPSGNILVSMNGRQVLP